MTVIGTLWGSVRQRQSKVILSVAAVNGFELELPPWSFTNRPKEYTDKFPYGKIPTFEGTDGFTLLEGATIARYLSSIGSLNLLGSNAKEAATIDQWVHYAEHEIGGPGQNIAYFIYGLCKPFIPEILEQFQERLLRALAHVEAHLASCPSGYVALDTLTFADFVLAGVTFHAAQLALGSDERKQFPHVFAHYERVTGDERVKKFWEMEKFPEVRATEPRALPTI